MEKIILEYNVPKNILRYIINFLDIDTIKIIIKNIKCMNVLDKRQKKLLVNCSKGFKWCCENGKIISAKILFDNLKKKHESVKKEYTLSDNNLFFSNEEILRSVCKKKHIEVSKWLYSVIEFQNEIMKEIFIESCQDENLVIIKWIHSLNIINMETYEKIFYLLLTNGYENTDILKELYLFMEKDSYSQKNNVDHFSLLMACSKGRLDIVKWIYSYGNIDICYNNNIYFRISCEYSHLEVAKWIYSLGNIDIHSNQEYAFRWACMKGYLDVSIWLYSLGGINIHIYNDYIFNHSKKKNTHIYEWLLTLP